MGMGISAVALAGGRGVVNWQWALVAKSDAERGFLEKLVQASATRMGTWSVIEREGRFLLCSERFVGVTAPAVARTKAQVLLDALIGVTDVLDVDTMTIELGNSIRVKIDD
jgi:hypothetical protein